MRKNARRFYLSVEKLDRRDVPSAMMAGPDASSDSSAQTSQSTAPQASTSIKVQPNPSSGSSTTN